MFRYETKIKLHETDAAGIMFFSQYFKLMHDAYEELLDSLGVGFSVMLNKKTYFLPIVHAQADYKKPLLVGDHLTIEVSKGSVGETSFSFNYRLLNDKKIIVATGKTVHVTVAKKTGKKILLPKEIKKALLKI